MKRINVAGMGYIEKRLGTPGRRRKIWEKLLRNWITVMDKYLVTTKDLPYWHGENANTSFLAAAAWKSGGVAIEQIYAERKNGRSRGHSDLRICFKKDFNFAIEAKRDETTKVTNIRKKLDEAKQNLADLDKGYRSKHLVSICFSFPRINKKKNNTFSKENFVKRITEAFGKKRNITIASYFPNPDMKMMTSREYKSKVVYFGVLLVARIEK